MRIIARSHLFPSALCLLLFTAAAPLAGCSTSGVQVHSAGLKTAPIDQYRTFAFGNTEHAPGGYAVTSRSIEVQRRMEPLISNELQRKGYCLAGASQDKKPDFIVRYSSGRRERDVEKSRPAHPAWLDEDEEDDFIEGALVIDVFDGSNDGQVWHGSSRTEIDPEKIDEPLLERSVTSLLAAFPAKRTQAP